MFSDFFFLLLLVLYQAYELLVTIEALDLGLQRLYMSSNQVFHSNNAVHKMESSSDIVGM